VEDAQARVEAAKAAADSARDAHSKRLLRGATVMHRSVRKARSAVEDAGDDIAAARGALAKVEASIGEYEEARARAERRIENTIAEIMASAIDGVIGQAEVLRHDLDGRHAVLR
jgi:hypothetical protein